MNEVLFLIGRGVSRFAKLLSLLTLRGAGPLGLAALLVPCRTQAVPYASAVTNNAGTVSFILNEVADNVTVRFDGGASMLDLGPQSQGTHSFSMGGATSFEIVVTKVGAAPWTLISSDTNPLLQFNAGRGVAVNMNPATPVFGRIYVANCAAGNTAGVTPGRSVGEGLYVLNADQSDALGQGNTASTAGIVFDAANGTGAPGGNSPWRLEAGEDNNLYIADFSTNTACIYYTDADVVTGGQVLAGVGWNRPASMNTVHTTIGGSPVVRGSLGAGTLTVWSTDGSYNRPSGGSLNRLLRWDVGAGPLPFAGTPTLLANPLINSVADVTTDCDRAPDGKFYLMQNRSAGNESGLFVVDTDGITVLWSSLAVSRSISNNPSAVDILRISRAVKVSPDGQRVALIRDDMQTWIIPLTNGIPDLSLRELVNTAGVNTTLGRDVCWDIAGNLYTLSSGNNLLRIFSPGGSAKAITRSDGTFTIIRPPGVSVAVTDDLASESGPDTATFNIYRTGSTDSPLTVYYALTGTATNGSDYVTNTLSAVIPAGMTNIEVTITPIDDTEAELTETVVLTVSSTSDYDLKPPIAATANIVDNDLPNVITITGGDTNSFEGTPADTLTFLLTRYGDTNGSPLIEFAADAGTAVAGSDFMELPSGLFLAPGVVTQAITVTILNDDVVEETETVGIRILPGGDVTPGTPDRAFGNIRDDDPPPACVLFSDNLDADTSANWTVLFGANNNVFDATVEWAYDYGALLGIPAAPHSAGGTTRGLRLIVNKDATASAAGINLYPIGRSFGGNYALRFDMYVSVGTSSTTEHTVAGLNHSGARTNRIRLLGTAPPVTTDAAGADGVWVTIGADVSNLRDYAAYTSTNDNTVPALLTNRPATDFGPLITSPPYFSPGGGAAGAPSNPSGSATPSWAEVELRQLNNVVTLKVNQNVIFQITNTTGFTNGNIMIGRNDAYDSTGSALSFTIFDNVQVVNLDIAIKSIQLLPPDQVQIDFVSPLGGVAGDFRLQSATDPAPANWTDDNSATITAIPTGFRAVTTQSGDARFYKIQR